MSQFVNYVTCSVLTSLVLIVSFVNVSNAAQKEFREFKTEINPGCNLKESCSSWTNISIVHVQSMSKHDNIHFIWSLIGMPSFVMARTSLNTTLSIKWDDFFRGAPTSVSFIGPEPYYIFGWVMPTLWMYNDAKDVLFIDKVNQTQVLAYNTSDFLWERQDNDSLITSSQVKIDFSASFYKLGDTTYGLGPNGTFNISIRLKSSEDYSTVLPFMLYNGNSSQIDVSLHQVQLNFTKDLPYPPHPRVGLQYILVQNEKIKEHPNDRMRVEKTATLDDEHTPGVFEVVNVKTPILGKDEQAYMQWKPICYTGNVRDVSDSVDVSVYPIKNITAPGSSAAIHDSLIYSLFGDEIEELLVESLNVTFGTQQDGFYNKTKGISWTYSTGYGVPPTDYVSMLVTLVVLIGLGIPIVIIIAAGFYLLAKRCRRPRGELLIDQ